MLPIIDLDDERFAEIAERARKSIAKYAPEWTDYNAHDPGITFLELFAWLKELQQFHLDQIGRESRLKFLKLLGNRRLGRNPAKAFVEVTGRQELVLPRTTRLLAGEMSFETVECETLFPTMLLGGFSQSGEERISFDGRTAGAGGKMRFYLFGKEALPENEFYLCLSQPAKAGAPLSFYLEIFDGYQVSRNPVNPEDDFVPLACLEWQYYGENGWEAFSCVEDGTHEMIASGRVRLTPDGPMKRMKLTEEGYWLRVVLKEAFYEVAPMLSGISLQIVEVEQRRTYSCFRDVPFPQRGGRIEINDALALDGFWEVYEKWDDGWLLRTEFYDRTVERAAGKAVFYRKEEMEPSFADSSEKPPSHVRIVCWEEEFTGLRDVDIGDGFPGQSFELSIPGLMEDRLALMVEREDGRFEDWHRVDDFDSAIPESLYYIFEEETGRLRFGDCERGQAPEGEIRIIACVSTEGVDGNAKAGQIREFENEEIPAAAVNHSDARGGRDTESLTDSFLRVRRNLRRVERAVTDEDYETLVRDTPGLMIAGCKTIPPGKLPKKDGSVDESCVSVVVQPYSVKGGRELNQAYIQNLSRRLAKRRLIGTKVSILSPEYVGVLVFCELSVKPYYRDAEERIREAVKAFFGEGNREFGKPVLYSAIYGILDTLDCVARVRSLSVDAQGKGIRRSINGDVLLPPNGLAYLKEADYTISAME